MSFLVCISKLCPSQNRSWDVFLLLLFPKIIYVRSVLAIPERLPSAHWSHPLPSGRLSRRACVPCLLCQAKAKTLPRGFTSACPTQDFSPWVGPVLAIPCWQGSEAVPSGVSGYVVLALPYFSAPIWEWPHSSLLHQTSGAWCSLCHPFLFIREV